MQLSTPPPLIPKVGFVLTKINFRPNFVDDGESFKTKTEL